MPLRTLALLLLLAWPLEVLNTQAFELLNGLHTPFLDVVWLSFTTLGDGLLLAIILGAFIVVNPRITVLGLVSIGMVSILVNVIKAAYPMPRPSELLYTIHTVGPVLRWGSFPSGHTAAAIAAVLALNHFCSSRILRALILSVGILISLSRIFVGAHFPRDVLWGAIFALVTFVVIVAYVWPRIRKKIENKPNHRNASFRFFLVVELTATLIALVLYTPLAAESPHASALVSSCVMLFVMGGYRNLSQPARHCDPATPCL